MTEHDHESLRRDHQAARVLADARAAGTCTAALDAFVDVLGCHDELPARERTAGEHAGQKLRVLATLRALLQIAQSAFRLPTAGAPVLATDALAGLYEACQGVDVIVFASRTLDEARQWAEPWLVRAEQIVSASRTALARGEPSLRDLTAAGQALLHTCKTSAEQLPGLAARFEALWTQWAAALETHPTVRAALALRERVRAQGWRYAEIVARARELAERDAAPTGDILDWILGSAPIPFGRSDDSEDRNGRNGYAHSTAAVISTALHVLDVRPGDTFYDLGSGLGLPCVVAALSTQAVCRGVEFHPGYVERARQNARELGLSTVEFFVGDAATFDWSDGDKFYMFNPFPQPVLRVIAARLAQLAARKPIRIACFHNTLPGDFRWIGGEGKIAVYEASAAPQDR